MKKMILAMLIDDDQISELVIPENAIIRGYLVEDETMLTPKKLKSVFAIIGFQIAKQIEERE